MRCGRIWCAAPAPRARPGPWCAPDLAAPALEQISHRLCAPRSGPTTTPRRRSLLAAGRVEVEAAVLAGFLAELAVLDLRQPGIAARLVDAGFEAGRAALREIRTAPRPRAALFTSTPPPAPARHPDLVLARAVAARALTHQEAVLIGATRLEPLRLADIARARGRTLAQTRAARVRAERKLSAYLRDPDRTRTTPAIRTWPPTQTPQTPAPAVATARAATPFRLRRSPRPDRRRRRSSTTRRGAATARPHPAAEPADPAAPTTKPNSQRRRLRRGAGGHEPGADEPHRHTLRRHRHRSGHPRRRATTDRPTGRRS